MQRERAPFNTRVCTWGARVGPLDLKGAPGLTSLIPHLLPAADADDDEQPLPASSSRHHVPRRQLLNEHGQSCARRRLF